MLIKNPRSDLRSRARIEVGEKLRNDLNNGANFGPVEDLFGIVSSHVDTTVAHGGAEIVVPVGAVDSVLLIKIHGIWNTGFVVPTTTHFGGF